MAKKSGIKNNSLWYWIIAALVFVVVIFIIKYILDIKSIVHRQENYTNKPQLTIVYAFSKTCPHCIQFEGTFDSVTRKFMDKYTSSYHIDIMKIERAQLSTEKYMQYVDGFPTVLVYKGSDFVKKNVGKTPADNFMKFLETSL